MQPKHLFLMVGILSTLMGTRGEAQTQTPVVIPVIQLHSVKTQEKTGNIHKAVQTTLASGAAGALFGGAGSYFTQAGLADLKEMNRVGRKFRSANQKLRQLEDIRSGKVIVLGAKNPIPSNLEIDLQNGLVQEYKKQVSHYRKWGAARSAMGVTAFALSGAFFISSYQEAMSYSPSVSPIVSKKIPVASPEGRQIREQLLGPSKPAQK